jgi:hypothetical protein
MAVKFWFLLGASLLTTEMFIRSGVLSRCWKLITIIRRAQRTLVMRGVTETRKEQFITTLWLQTMESTAVLAVTILAVFSPLVVLYLADNMLNLHMFALLDWSLNHFALISMIIVYSFVRKRYGT